MANNSAPGMLRVENTSEGPPCAPTEASVGKVQAKTKAQAVAPLQAVEYPDFPAAAALCAEPLSMTRASAVPRSVRDIT